MKLNETILAESILEETDRAKLPEGVLCRISYPICDIGQKNANDRVYEQDVWDKVHEEKDLKDKLENRALFGHAEHPEQTQSNLEKTSHVIFEMWTENGQEWQKFDVLDTPCGRIVDCLIRSCRVGCSTRAEGDLEEAEDDEGNSYQKVVAESYRYVTTDFTADPSTFGSIPYDVKRNVVSEVKKLFENKEADEGEKEFGACVLESMTCKDKSKCQKCGTCQVLEEKKLSAKAEDELPKSAIYQCNICLDKFDDPADVNTEDLCKKCAKRQEEKKIKETMRWIRGQDEKWHEIGPEDRDFEHALSQEDYAKMGQDQGAKRGFSPPRKAEEKTIESLIKEAIFKVGDSVLLQYAQDDIKEAKVEKIEEAAITVGVGTTVVSVNGDAAVSVSPEGLITILPTETLAELGQKEPKIVDVPEQAPEEVSPCPDEGEPTITDPGNTGMGMPEVTGDEEPFEKKIEVGATVQFDQIPEGKCGVILTGSDIGQGERKPKYFDTPEEAKEYAARMNKQLTKGEKGYYKLKYRTVEGITVGSTVELTKEALETYRRSHHTPSKEDWVRNIKFDENDITEGKVTKIEETGITISLDDGTQVSIEDPSAVNITVTAPAPAEEIQPVLPPEEEVEAMAAAGPLPIDGDIPESKIDEVKFAAGNLLQDKDGKDWIVKEAGDGSLTITQPGEPGTEKSIAWADVDSHGFTKVSESIDEDSSRKEFLTRRIKSLKKEKDTFEKEHQRKVNRYEKELKALAAEGSGIKGESKEVEEATSVEKNGEWFVESPSGATLGGPYKSRVEADKRKKDVEFYAASKESKVDEMAVSGAIYVDKEAGDKVTIKHIGLDDRTGEAVVNVEAGDPGSMTTEYSGKEFLEKFELLGPPGRFGTGRKRESKVEEDVKRKIICSQCGQETEAVGDLEGKKFTTQYCSDCKAQTTHAIHEAKVDEGDIAIATTAKEIKDLRVVEASTRAERDKAVELLEEITDGNTQLEEKVRKEKAFEIKLLVNKIEKTLETKEQELSAVRTKLEEKAKLAADLTDQLGEQKNLVDKAQKQWEDVVVAATNRVNDMKETAAVAKDEHQKSLLESKEGHQEAIRQLTETNETKIETVKEEVAKKVREEVTKEFVKCFVGFKLSETNLVVDDNSQALLENCKSLTEVEELLEEITDVGRRSALHSDSIKSIHVSKTKVDDPEMDEAERQVTNALQGMNS